MTKSTIKISARLNENSVQQIKKELDDVGCKNITEFIQIAVSEKLERNSLVKMIQYSIKAQEKLNSQLIELTVIAAKNNSINNKNIEKLAVAITKISQSIESILSKE